MPSFGCSADDHPTSRTPMTIARLIFDIDPGSSRMRASDRVCVGVIRGALVVCCEAVANQSGAIDERGVLKPQVEVTLTSDRHPVGWDGRCSHDAHLCRLGRDEHAL